VPGAFSGLDLAKLGEHIPFTSECSDTVLGILSQIRTPPNLHYGTEPLLVEEVDGN
jgi:hypothetical protein